VARFRVARTGSLKLTAVDSMASPRPENQQPVQSLVSTTFAERRFHRFFYEVLFKSRAAMRGAVVVGASSVHELQDIGTRLVADPDSTCDGRQDRCVVFPEACTVSLEMEITVNGATATLPLGSSLASVAPHPRRAVVVRNYSGHPTPIEIPPNDIKALQLPLLPGDRVSWE
jgi:hypothetical protein